MKRLGSTVDLELKPLVKRPTFEQARARLSHLLPNLKLAAQVANDAGGSAEIAVIVATVDGNKLTCRFVAEPFLLDLAVVLEAIASDGSSSLLVMPGQFGGT